MRLSFLGSFGRNGRFHDQLKNGGWLLPGAKISVRQSTCEIFALWRKQITLSRQLRAPAVNCQLDENAN